MASSAEVAWASVYMPAAYSSSTMASVCSFTEADGPAWPTEKAAACGAGSPYCNNHVSARSAEIVPAFTRAPISKAPRYLVLAAICQPDCHVSGTSASSVLEGDRGPAEVL